MAIGALVVGCSSTAATPSPTAKPHAGWPLQRQRLLQAAPTATQRPPNENVTIEVMASQDWIKVI